MPQNHLAYMGVNKLILGQALDSGEAWNQPDALSGSVLKRRQEDMRWLETEWS
jgi:hypothetical protein